MIAIVAYPTLPESDRQWIESIRAANDPLSSRLRLHFTLAFPAEAPPAAVASEASAVAMATGSIAFTIRRAEAIHDAIGDGAHVFLVPNDGGDEIVKLHERLYEGILRPHRRGEVPFVPHITVAASRNFKACRRLAWELNETQRTVRGRLESIEVIDVGTASVASVAAYALAGVVSPPSGDG